ncbi:MAG: hypothetical protein KBG28_13115 [Kofleriaceae bacterium]|nr:hypothetical protein [Kofleriaceae bacterium]MBP9204904.1 hypothetical protein [Kofleriaceae bacterium]
MAPASDELSSVSLAAQAIERLDLGEPAKQALRAILAELAAQYQQSFVQMLETQRIQASALERLQTTLHLLIEKIAPEIRDRIPVAIRIVDADARPDIASTVVIADPIATGYTMTQANLAQALGISPADVSVLVRAFRLTEDGDCAVTVRRGPKSSIVNFHPRALDRFRELVASPPERLSDAVRKSLERARRRLITGAR